MTRALALGAALLAAAFVACHLLGLREHVSVLSGTAPPGSVGDATLGVAHALAWFGGVIVAPILALAAGVLALLDRLGVAGARAASPAAPRQQVAAGATGEPPPGAPARRDAARPPAWRARPPGE
ncbi:hypothetical protein WME91_49305 [Sorangium sp. So ce269]